MRLVLFVILMGCSQRYVATITGGEEAGGTPPPDCITPSPLCPDTDIGKEGEGGKESEKKTEENTEQETPTNDPTEHPSSSAAAVNYYFGGTDKSFKVNVKPESIPKNKEVELTIVVETIHDKKAKPKDNHGRYRPYDLGILAHKAVSDGKVPDVYRLDKASPLNYFPEHKKPQCNTSRSIASWTRCELKIKQMNKGDVLTVTMKVKAAEDFAIGRLENRDGKSLIIKIE